MLCRGGCQRTRLLRFDVHTLKNSTTTGPHPRQSFTNSHLLTRVRYDVRLCVTVNTLKSLAWKWKWKWGYRLLYSPVTYPALRGYALFDVLQYTIHTNVNNIEHAKFLSTRYFKIGLANIIWFANIWFPVVVDVIESTSVPLRSS